MKQSKSTSTMKKKNFITKEFNKLAEEDLDDGS